MMRLLKPSSTGDSTQPSPTTLAARLALLLSILIIQACATSSAITSARNQFRYGDTPGALQTLKEADVSYRDELLLLFDKGLIAQAAGDYPQSISAFEKAYQIVEQLDYISLRDQSMATLANDWATRYGGEISERLWIHTFQMINFLMIDQPTGAAVEARRAVVLYEEHDDVLDNDAFTRGLMALSFEAAGQYDSAAVEYRKLAKVHETDDAWKVNRSGKELLLMVASGFIEPKYPGDLVIDINARISFPYYPEVFDQPPQIDVLADSRELKLARLNTPLLQISRSALAKRGKAIAARQAIRLAAKYNLTKKIEEEDALLGGIAKLFLFVIEQADTRSWETLPSHLSLLRVSIPDKTSSVKVRIDSRDTSLTHAGVQEIELRLDEHKTQFHMIRTGIDEPLQVPISP